MSKVANSEAPVKMKVGNWSEDAMNCAKCPKEGCPFWVKASAVRTRNTDEGPVIKTTEDRSACLGEHLPKFALPLIFERLAQVEALATAAAQNSEVAARAASDVASRLPGGPQDNGTGLLVPRHLVQK